MKVAWLYHDIMDLYGDTGNMMVLEARCKARGIPFELSRIGIGDDVDLSDYDLVFLGGGADRDQQTIAPDLMARKENLRKAMDEGTFVLLICGGYQLFGQYYQAADGSKMEGLGFYPFYTDTGKQGSRCIGNVVVDAELEGKKVRLVGFENHGGQTLQVTSPLGKVIKGEGNAFQAGYEGFYDGHILATYLHGPLLPKNPDVADLVILKAMQKKQPDFGWQDLMPLDDSLERLARNQVFEKLGLEKEESQTD